MMSYEPDRMKITLDLLSVLENLFFSMKIPAEIVSKYNMLKESAFGQLGLSFTPVDENKYQKASGLADSTPAALPSPSSETSYKAIDSSSTYLPLVK